MIVKMAIALMPEDYERISDKNPYIFSTANIVRKVETPDDNYMVIYWEFPPFEEWDELLTEMRHDIASCRHSLIEVTDEEVYFDVDDSDIRGTDEEFNEIFGWRADICLWNDESEVLTADAEKAENDPDKPNNDRSKLSKIKKMVDEVLAKEPSDEDLDFDDKAIQIYADLHNLKDSLEEVLGGNPI